MKRKITSLFLTSTFIFSQITTSNIFADSGSDRIEIIVNETPVESEQAPVIENGRTLVPFRAVSEAMGIEVLWNSAEKTITCKKADKTVSVSIGSNEIDVDGKKIILDVSPKIIDGTTFVPLRAISESFGADVNWNGETKTVEIKSGISETKPLESSENQSQETSESENNSNVYDLKDNDGNVLIHSEVIFDTDKLSEKTSEFIKSKLTTAKELFSASITDVFGSSSEDDIIKELTDFRNEFGENFNPYEFIFMYDIIETDNFVSINEYVSLYTGGAHPTNAMSSKIYDLDTEKEVTLDDISKKLFNKTSEEIIEQAKKLFIEKIDSEPESFFEDSKETLDTINKYNFYLTEKGIVFYFNQYEIAPYAAGIIDVTVEF